MEISLFLVFIISFASTLFLLNFDIKELSSFGPTALIYINGFKEGLIISTSVLFFALIILLFFKKNFLIIIEKVNLWFNKLSHGKQYLFILMICVVFSFAVHGDSVINGYFNMDDFEIISINHSHTIGESILIPHGNDHTMPLFMLEMRVLDYFFGQNALPYNLFIFFLFSLIPFFIYLIFERLNFNRISFFIFLILFSGATGWADLIGGFNIMSTYMQAILFFTITMWSYLEWHTTKQNKFLLFFGLSILGSITIDLPGIWVLPVIPVWMFVVHIIKDNLIQIKLQNIISFLKNNKPPLLIFITTILLFLTFFIFTFTVVQPNTFLTALDGGDIATNDIRDSGWKPSTLLHNSVSVFSSGVSLTLFAPNAVKILSHPSLVGRVQKYWSSLEFLILFLNLLFLFFLFKNSDNKNRRLYIFLASIFMVSISMVVIARPNQGILPDFDYRYAGPAFFAYILFIALASNVFLVKNKEKTLKILLPVIIIIFSIQQAFSFQAVRIREEAKLRKSAIVQFEKTLLPELEKLSENNKDIVIPNLSGAHIFNLMSGYTLADYLLFFNKGIDINLIQNKYMQPDVKTGIVETVSSIRDQSSIVFKEAINNSSFINKYYTSQILMRFATSEQKSPDLKSVLANEYGDIVIHKNNFDPEKLNVLGFYLTTDDVPGNLELSISFKNEFNKKDESQNIRIDDFTPHILENNKRIYYIETNLLQIHTYSLSALISNLRLHVPETKNASVEALYFK